VKADALQKSGKRAVGNGVAVYRGKGEDMSFVAPFQQQMRILLNPPRKGDTPLALQRQFVQGSVTKQGRQGQPYAELLLDGRGNPDGCYALPANLEKANMPGDAASSQDLFPDGAGGDVGKCAAGQGRVIQRVEIPPRKVGQPPGSKSLEVCW